MRTSKKTSKGSSSRALTSQSQASASPKASTLPQKESSANSANTNYNISSRRGRRFVLFMILAFSVISFMFYLLLLDHSPHDKVEQPRSLKLRVLSYLMGILQRLGTSMLTMEEFRKFEQKALSAPLASVPYLPTNALAITPTLIDLPISFTEGLLQTPKYCSTELKPLFLTQPQLRSLRSQKYFFALNLYNNEAVSPHLFLQLLKLMHFLSPEGPDGGPTLANSFVSIYESGSTDKTPSLATYFKIKLDKLGVKNKIIVQGTDFVSHRQDQDVDRITFMAQIRNKALEDLYASPPRTYDKLVFLNDVYFCWQDVIRLLLYEVDMACGLDIINGESVSGLIFYDIWVGHDRLGNTMSNNYPFFANPSDQEKVKKGEPIPVFCCWNARTEPFYEKNIRFRRATAQLDDKMNNATDACDESECGVICWDFFRHKYRRILVDPQVRVTYHENIFPLIVGDMSWEDIPMNEKLDARFNNYAKVTPVSAIEFSPDFPRTTRCCPVTEENKHGGTNIDYCYIRRYSDEIVNG